MKKVFLAVMCMMAFFLQGNQAMAQGFKVGVFDIEIMVQAMPGYNKVDSLVQLFERDTLSSEYDYYQSEFKRLDSTYRADSSRGKSQAVLNQELQQRQQVGMNLVYWQQISQNRSEQRRALLAQPLYERVAVAYKKVLDTRKYDLVLKPNAFEMGSKVDNIFLYVAKELKIRLPDELGGGQEPVDERPATPAPGGSRPAPKKN